MKKISILLVILLLFSCKKNPSQIIETDDYELIIPNNPKAILILFPGFGGNAQRIKSESKIPKEAVDNQIAVMLFNSFNKHILLREEEKNEIKQIILSSFKKNNLESIDVFLGGFSSGGNIALLMVNKIKSNGVFIVDSPVDLESLYNNSLKQINKNISIEEPKFIIDYLEFRIGNPINNNEKYEKYSPFISSTKSLLNLKTLKELKIRLYTEPDLKWWKQYNDDDYIDLNSFFIKNMYQSLLDNKLQNVELIETKNKGYRSDGRRHPHSWSIVDEEEIVEWILKNN